MSNVNKKLKMKLSEVPIVAANGALKVSRRSFIIGSSAAIAGIAMGFALTPKISSAASVNKLVADGAFTPDLNASINPDGSIIFNGWNPEMGQHVATAQAQVFCEHLEANWDDVKFYYPNNNLKVSMRTVGSASITKKYNAFCQAGAAAKLMLLGIAAEHLGVPVKQLTAKNSEVIDIKSGKKLSYGYLAKLGVPPTKFTKKQLKVIKLKPASQWTLIGKSINAADIPDKTTGKAMFGMDVVLDNMAVGVPAAPPVRLGASVKSVDDSQAKKVKGFIKYVIIKDPFRSTTGFVIALADSYWNAYLAARALKIEYEMGPNTKVSSKDILARAIQIQKNPKSKRGKADNFGKPIEALKKASSTFTAAYEVPFHVHAPMEPMNAAVEFIDGSWHYHIGCQMPNAAAKTLAKMLKVKSTEIVMHQKYIGGGFGRRATSMRDVMYMAAASAKVIKRPVKVIWPREVDMQFDFYRPSGYYVFTAGMDDKGKLDVIYKDCVTESAFGIKHPLLKKFGYDIISLRVNTWYTLPNERVHWMHNDLGQRTTMLTAWRAVGNGPDYFAGESFIDEIAHKLNKDPLDFRLEYLTGEGRQGGKAPFSLDGAVRMNAALRAVAKMCNYKKSPGPNRGMGISATSTLTKHANPTFIGCIADVEVDLKTGELTVHDLYLAVDNGLAVNPGGAEAQISGGALWGLDSALKQNISMTDGAIDQTNFDGYSPIRMKEVPGIHVKFIGTGKYTPTGCGEMGTPAVPPAIANAIFNAVGARVRSTPITAEKIKAALKKKG